MGENIVKVKNIISEWWQPKKDNIGQIVENNDDIHQCIRNILTTIIGSVPLEPDLGCYVFDYIDKPVNTAKPGIIKAVIDAINRWETRIDIKSVNVSFEISNIIVNVTWTLKNSADINNTDITYERQSS